ncbi:MAG TPA: dihydroorotate dehydrogenase-like protein [Vicinamibacterales bacterium]|jgi:dihydroorotate dehydrogenase (fumarate)|nr:dihydroorotate dehydrogenase-like protein [Vicinamibacterales bacterium]
MKVEMTTTYLGLKLAHPFMAGASPMSAHLDGVKRLEDAGSAAIVLHSLFEEQVEESTTGRIHGIDPLEDRQLAARVAMFPPSRDYPFEPDEHLEHLRRVKAAVRVPVIASLNGTSRGPWLRYALLFQEAGADAIEVNFYGVVSSFDVSAEGVEGDILRAIHDLKASLHIPVAVKLSPFFSAFANMASRLDKAGADGLVLFNRFYQPDIDIDNFTAGPSLELSRSSELLLRLRWLAILYGRIRPSMAVTGGVQTWQDGVKAILAGAHAVQIVSALLREGPEHLTAVIEQTAAWMDRRQISSIDDIRGRVSLRASASAENFERANYIRTLHRWTDS